MFWLFSISLQFYHVLVYRNRFVLISFCPALSLLVRLAVTIWTVCICGELNSSLAKNLHAIIHTHSLIVEPKSTLWKGKNTLWNTSINTWCTKRAHIPYFKFHIINYWFFTHPCKFAQDVNQLWNVQPINSRMCVKSLLCLFFNVLWIYCVGWTLNQLLNRFSRAKHAF